MRSTSDRGGDFSIWELDVGSQALTQLTFEAEPELDPAWDPTGRSLAYVRQRGDVSSLMVRNPGEPTRRLISSPGRLRAPSWRPDATVITVVADTAQGPLPDISTLQDTPEPASVLCAFPHLTLLPGKLLAQRAFQQVEDRGILTHV